MKWKSVHHPDWCPTVIRRRISQVTLDLIAFTFETVTSRAGNILYGSCYPNRSAYWSAQYRLKKAGLIAYRRTGGRMPVLQLTDEGNSKLSPACRRRPPWPKDCTTVSQEL